MTSFPAYKRSDWRHWTDADRDCQNERHELLIRKSEVEVAFADDKQCRVVSGRWRDPYTGSVFTDASQLDIDHVVALKDAHESGGHAWSKTQKKAFANDPYNMVPVSSSANRSKGSKGPDEWLPPNPEYRCEYIYWWRGTKERYGLSLSTRERALVDYMEHACLTGSIPPLPQ